MPYNNFDKYRRALKNASLPCLPFIGIYCRDLTLIEEGNSNYLENGHVNLEKMRMKTAILKEILMYQSTPFQFSVTHNIQNFLNNINVLEEPTIKKLSFQVEPRSDVL